MSEKRLIDLDELMRIAFRAESSHDVAEEFNKLPSPTLPDVCGKRTLDSMTEEESKEYRKVFMSKCRQDAPLSEVIESVLLHISWDEVPLLAVKWLLEKGFNVFGGVDK